jgi:hypothetical protein
LLQTLLLKISFTLLAADPQGLQIEHESAQERVKVLPEIMDMPGGDAGN